MSEHIEIKGVDFLNINMQRYWSFPSSYSISKRKEQLNLMLYSDEYVASKKEDGYAELFIKDANGDLTMRARNKGVNGWICKQDWVPHIKDFFKELPNETVVLGEVYLPGKTSRSITSILGCGMEKAIDRQKGENILRLSIFDVLAYDGLLTHSWPITERVKILEKIRPATENHPHVKVVEYWDTPEEIHDNWLKILAEGGEGVVLTRKDNPYEFGKRTARHTLKLKKELQDTVDVFLTGKYKEATKEYSGTELESWPYWYDDLKDEKIEGALHNTIDLSHITPVTRLWFYGMAGAVEIATIMNGKVTPIGYLSGISDDVRSGIVENPEEWKGKVIELQAMEITEVSGLPAFRHARIMKWRPDKSWKECIWTGDE